MRPDHGSLNNGQGTPAVAKLFLSVECRFEKNVIELESSLMIETEQNLTTRRELSEAHQRDEELLRQIADANRKSTELQTAVQRSFYLVKQYKICARITK
jgi:hypothetical protein